MLAQYSYTQAQPYVKRNTFTTNDGLPSNHIYDITEDDKGFLWIATDNGVSRFDGKYFQHFSVRQGLPSNEVLQIVKDGAGNIWANSYKQLPAYFDEINGHFITVTDHPHLKTISNSLLNATVLNDGAIKFQNSEGYVVLKNKKVTDFNDQYRDRIIIDKQAIDISLKAVRNGCYYNYLYLNLKKVDSIKLELGYRFIKTSITDNMIFHITNKKKIYKISGFSLKPFSYQLDILTNPGNIAWYKFVAQYMIVTNTEGNVYVYNKNDLCLITRLEHNIKANCAYIDRAHNIWVGTLDEGLACYDNNKIRNINLPAGYIRPNFLSIAVNQKNELFAGNYYGQVISVKNGIYSKHENPYKNYQTWIRTLICVKDKLIAVNDRGYSINFSAYRQTQHLPHKETLLKDAVAVNDSLIVFGTLSGLVSLNLNSGRTKNLNSNYERTLSLVTAGNNIIYYIGDRGLYKYNTSTNTAAFISLNGASGSEHLSALAYGSDGILWAGTLNGSLLAIKDDHVLAVIKDNASLPENITCMLVHDHKLWIGGKTGISVLSYSFSGSKPNYKISRISKNDGLPSNTINDLAARDDSIYVATERGIAVIPANYQNPAFEISPQLTGIKINQTNIPIASQYQLESDQNNITLQFAGIDLSGHFKAIQYRLNDDHKWGTLEGNTLNIQLASGRHTIYIRAVDANNQISRSMLQLHFFIKTPYYKSIWFWIIVPAILLTSIFWWLNWMRLQKQKMIYERQLALEQQRRKITADLHDDIGATLSSLQLNSAIASQLIGTDKNKATTILSTVEDQAKNLAEKIGDIIWSMKPGKDEFMTISSRIKNFAHDILAPIDIAFKIHIDQRINTHLQDIAIRKNIVLITKEAINNIAKYSQATEVYIGIEADHHHIRLLIRDNGIGIDAACRKGNGLDNMRIRTEELNGAFTIDSVYNTGTTIVASIPCSLK